MTEKYIESLTTAIKKLQIADHMAYITFPLINEQKLILKILNEINLSILSIITAVLQYEYLYKRIQLYRDSKDNLRTFFQKCAPRYNIDKEQIREILDILSIAEKHKNSSMEFIRNNKIVIMSENMKTNSIDLEQIKSYLQITKDLLKKTKDKMSIK